jgi:hypothetical protein
MANKALVRAFTTRRFVHTAQLYRWADMVPSPGGSGEQ